MAISFKSLEFKGARKPRHKPFSKGCKSSWWRERPHLKIMAHRWTDDHTLTYPELRALKASRAYSR